jgi:hypothetical protein
MESILILMQNGDDILLQSVCHKLGQEFQWQTNQENGYVIIHGFWIRNFRNDNYMSKFDAL